MNVELPGQGLLQGYKTGVEGSPEVAAAPWAALGEVGREISQLGEKGMAFLVERQRSENRRMANELEVSMEEEFARFETEELRQHEPGKWAELWEKRLEARMAKDLPEGLAPEQRDLLGERFKGIASRTRRELWAKSAVMEAGRARESYGKRIDSLSGRGDFPAARTANNEGYQAKYYPKEAWQAKGRQIDRAEKFAGIHQEIEADPAGALTRLEAKKADGTWANHDLAPKDRERLIGTARVAERDAVFAVIKDFNDGVESGDVVEAGDIDRFFPHASEGLRWMMKDTLDPEGAAREWRATPEGQVELTGVLDSMIRGYRLDQDGYDRQALEIGRLIPEVRDEGLRGRLQDDFATVKTGQEIAWKNKGDEYRERFHKAYLGEGFGPRFQRKPLGELLESGLLEDPVKLEKAGMGWDAFEAVAYFGKSEEELRALGKRRPTVESLTRLGIPWQKAGELVARGGRAAQVGVFRELYDPVLAKGGLDDYDSRALEAIRSGKERELVTPDTVAEQQARAALGGALTEWEKWYRLKGSSATEPELEKKYTEIAGPLVERSNRTGFFPEENEEFPGDE